MKVFYLSVLLIIATALHSFETTCPYGCDRESAENTFYSLRYFLYEAFPDKCCVYHRFRRFEGYCNSGIFQSRKIEWSFDKYNPSLSCSPQRFGYTNWIEEGSHDCYLENLAGGLSGLSFVQTEIENYIQNETSCYKDSIQWTEHALIHFKKLQAKGNSSCCGGISSIAVPIEKQINEEEVVLKNRQKDQEEFEKKASYLQKRLNEVEQEVLNQYETQFQYCLKEHHWKGAYYGQGLLNFHRGEITEALDNIRNFIDSLKEDEKNQLNKEIFLQKGTIEAEVGLYNDAIVSLTEAIRKDSTCKEAYFERAAAYFEAGEFDLALKDYLSSGMRPDQANNTVSFSLEYGSGLINGIKKGLQEEFGEGLPLWAPMLNVCLWVLTQSPLPQAKIISATLACIGAAGAYLAAHQISSELRELVLNWDQMSDQQRGELTGYLIGRHGFEIFAIAGSTKLMKAYRDLKRANNMLTFEMMLVEESQVASIKSRYKMIEKRRKDSEYIRKYFGKNNYAEQEIRNNLKTMGYQIPQRPSSIPDNFTTKFADGCGICYVDPANPHEYIRLMPGNPHSPNPAQQQTYIVHMRNGSALTKDGILISKKKIEAHIPPDEYKYLPLNKDKKI